MAYTPPTVQDFKDQFPRDFSYGSTPEVVNDFDIENGQKLASFNIREGLFGAEVDYQFAYNLLSAHYLVTSLKNSSQGVSNSFNWTETSKGVGSVSQSFSAPDSVMQNPALAAISKTGYGAQYLEIVLPLTYGNIGNAQGGTQA